MAAVARGGSDDADQLRLLIATDNHLGVWEDDEIRKHDSFVTFEEILQTAHRLKVDALLLGGDLFHDNKPSRRVSGARAARGRWRCAWHGRARGARRAARAVARASRRRALGVGARAR